MTNETPPNQDMKNVWQNQELEGIRMSIDEIQQKAGKFQKKILWRNGREYVAAFVIAVYFGFELWRTTDVLTQIGFGLVIAGLLYMVGQLHRKGSSRSLPAEMGLANCLEFHRSELVRQRDLVRSIWRWYLAPVIPGLVVVMAALARTNPGHLRHLGLFLGFYYSFVVLFFLFTWRLNESGARRLQRRIDELDDMKGQR